ncbi:MAG: potassium transporter TrkG [Rikenellaceae bacterium]
MKNLSYLFLYRKRLIMPYVEMLLKLLNNVAILASALLIVTVVFEYGFIVSEEEYIYIGSIYRFTWIVFIVNSLAQLIFTFRSSLREYGRLAWVMTLLLYITLVPQILPEPYSGFWCTMWRVLQGGVYHTIVLSVLSLLYLSDCVVKLLGRRINPSFIFAASFLVIILIGAGLLMLPRATYEGISFVDALFTSTSATCVTGLTTVDVTEVFTPIGFIIIMILIQIGGLGVMTITSFFALFFMGNTSLSNQSLLSEMVSSRSLSSLLSMLIYIFGFTIAIEGIGAAMIFVDIHSTLGMTIDEEIGFSIFHSISAFCNAGFSTLPGNLGNEMLMSGHNPFYLYISALVILGGIGFPILVNLNDWVRYLLQRGYKRFINSDFAVERQVHIYDINTKIAVAVSLILFVVGTLLIGVLEWNVAFVDMPIVDRCVQAFFSAVCPRTAGFASVSMGSFTVQTIIIMTFLMVIGGGSQSTAGGIKVNAFAVILLNIKSVIQGSERVALFNRQLSVDSIRRSNSTLVLYIMFLFVAVFLLTIFEPDAPHLSLLFESISALSTVGSSLDLTPTLGTDSKFVIIVLMFIGRVGVLTIMASVVKQRRVHNVYYASGQIILN